MSLATPSASSSNTSYSFDIFLSHSGQQKLFVHYLYHELQRANYTVFFDQDTRESLPKGSHLLSSILNAIQDCRLGVVVISEGFITTLWPMMELQHLLDNPGCIVYPVFYELNPGELTNSKRVKKWQKHWKDLAKKKQNQGYPINVNVWPQLLERLRNSAGTIIPIATSQQILYEKLWEIVLQICHRIPPPLFYYDKFIKGKEITQEVIKDHYRHILEENSDVGLLVLGVTGIPGSGKTTMCKTMVDYYNQHEFPGICALLELPTDEAEKEKMIPKLKIALEKITFAQKSMIENVTDIEQANCLFKQVKKQYFLAIDNVSEWSELYVHQVLEILRSSNLNVGGTTIKPKIIVTSRSEVLLEKINVETVIDVPKLKEEEALDIILSYGRCWELYQAYQRSNEFHIKNLLNICYVKYGFHPLLFKTLGNIMSHLIKKNGYGWEQCIHALKSTCLGLTQQKGEMTSLFQSNIEKNIQSNIEKNIFNALEVNYNHLEENLKNIFIDIAILYPNSISLQNLSMLKDYQHIGNMEFQVAWLEYYGLWRVRRSLNNKIEGIEIHDLYKVLAKREAKANGRFLVFLDCETIIAPPSLSKVTRIVNNQRKRINVRNLEGIDFSELVLDRVEILNFHAHDIEIVIDALRCARTTITVVGSSFQRLLSNLNDNLGRLFGKTYELRDSLCFNSLSILKLECGDNVTKIDALGCALNLQSLTLTKCYALKDIKGVEKLKRLQELILDASEGWFYHGKTNLSLDVADFRGCIELKTLSIERFNKLKSLGDIYCPSSLESLSLNGNHNLVDVSAIGSFGENLIEIDISNCENIKVFPYMSLPKLERFEIYKCAGLEVMMNGAILGDENFPCLKELSIQDCPNIRALPQIAKSSGLERLYTPDCVFNLFNSTLGSDISSLEITMSKEQFIISNYNESIGHFGSTNLESLRIKVLNTCNTSKCRHNIDSCSCNYYQESTLVSWECNNPCHSLSFLRELHCLVELKLEGFDFIRSLDELASLTNLEHLFLKGFAILEMLPSDLSCLKELQSLQLHHCRSLRRLPHKWSTSNLERVCIFGCPALENFQGTLNSSCSCLTKIRYLRLDYKSSCCFVNDGSVALDFSNLEYIHDLGLQGFTSSSLSSIKWPKSVYCLRLTKCNMQYSCSILDVSNLINIHELTISSCTPSISCWMNLCKWPPTLKSLSLESNVFDVNELYPCIDCGIMSLSELTSLSFNSCNRVQSLKGVQCPTNLVHLSIRDCQSLKETLT